MVRPDKLPSFNLTLMSRLSLILFALQLDATTPPRRERKLTLRTTLFQTSAKTRVSRKPGALSIGLRPIETISGSSKQAGIKRRRDQRTSEFSPTVWMKTLLTLSPTSRKLKRASRRSGLQSKTITASGLSQKLLITTPTTTEILAQPLLFRPTL